MQRNTLKRVASHSPRTHHRTPQKARLQGTIQTLKDLGVPFIKEDIFKAHGFCHTSGYKALKEWNTAIQYANTDTVDPEIQVELDAGEIEQAQLIARGKESYHDDAARRPRNSTRRVETRGRPEAISKEQRDRMEHIIEDYGQAGHRLSWQALAHECSIEASTHTIRKMMGTLNYRHCKSCKKGWVDERTAKNRVDFSKIMLDRYPDEDDWKQVRFSDEVHFGYAQGIDTPYVLCKPGQKTCTHCIQQDVPPDDKTQDKVHAWAAVGYDFKSPMVFYDAGNSNGKMTHNCYVNQILDPIVKPWIHDATSESFCLEEDGDSGHGGSRYAWKTDPVLGQRVQAPEKENIVQRWKRENSLKFYFNCHSSPDLSPIENCWIGPKQHVNGHVHWDSETTKEYALNGWTAVSQDHINERVISMPDRLRACIELDGQYTGY
jgi:hypothetical protein